MAIQWVIHIHRNVIIRRYYRGIKNLFDLYIPICNNWLIIDNMDLVPEIIARGTRKLGEDIINNDVWEVLKIQRNESH